MAHVYHGHGLGVNRWGPGRYAWESLRDGDGVHTRAHSAAISRALRRLEKRGLLMRGNESSGGSADGKSFRDSLDEPFISPRWVGNSKDGVSKARTVNIKLTALGYQMIEGVLGQ